MGAPRTVTWTVGRCREGDSRLYVRVDREELGPNAEEFIFQLQQLEVLPRQHLVSHVEYWHTDCVIVRLDIGDRSSNAQYGVEPPTVPNQFEFDRHKKRLSDAVRESLEAIHGRLVEVTRDINPEPRIVENFRMMTHIVERQRRHDQSTIHAY